MSSFGLISGRRLGSPWVALVSTVLLGLVATGPALASGPLHLSKGGVTPSTGYAGDAFRFTVTYLSHDGVGPLAVELVLNGTDHPMSEVVPGSIDFKQGVQYATTLTLGAGTYTWGFLALHRNAQSDQWSAPGPLTVKPRPSPSPTPAPTSTPKPTPAATPQPTSNPTPRPTSSPADTPSSSGASATPGTSTTGGGSATGSGDTTTGSTPGASPGPGVGPASQGGDGPTHGPLIGAVVPGGVAVPPGGAGGNPPGGSGPTGGSSAGGSTGPTAGGSTSTGPGGTAAGGQAALTLLTGGLPPFGTDAWFQLAAQTLATSTAASSAMALALFGMRRRHDDEEQAGSNLSDPYNIPHDAYDPALATATAVADPELSMPRWRRPSLREARRSKPGENLEAVEAERLTFDHGAVQPSGERELRRIRYRLVRLGDGPDEILSTEIGRLDQGDEVELLQRSGAYWQVRTPLGQVGWVHRMTLGELLPPEPTRIPAGGGELDPDLLMAYSQSQAAGPRDMAGEGLASQLIRERLSHR